MISGFQREIKSTDSHGKALAHPEWDLDVLCGTYGTMGVGVTLTAADKIVLMEPVGDPGKEIQAIARPLRINQKREVKVIKMKCPTVPIEGRLNNTNTIRKYLVERIMSS